MARTKPLGRILSSTQFWDLMERWRVPVAVALDLIGHTGHASVSGKRPRFRFITQQQRITLYLAELEEAMAVTGRDAAWLHRKIRAAPFDGRTPLDLMVHGGPTAIADVLRYVNRDAMRKALRG